ncbi:MAG: cupin domain-containing protein [Cystobacter sp.]
MNRLGTWLFPLVLGGCVTPPASPPPTLAAAPPAQAQAPAIIHGPEGDSSTFLSWRAASLPMKEARPGLFATDLVGHMASAGVYVVRVRLVPGGRNAPHTHPDGRLTTVLSGTLHYGRSDTIDPEQAQVFGPGDVYYTPPGAAHWQFAGPEGAVYDETGFGPSALVPVSPPSR